MAITTKLARKVLNKADQRHLTESGIRSMDDLRRQLGHMREMNPDDPGHVCRDCYRIAHKLGEVS